MKVVLAVYYRNDAVFDVLIKDDDSVNNLIHILKLENGVMGGIRYINVSE